LVDLSEDFKNKEKKYEKNKVIFEKYENMKDSELKSLIKSLEDTMTLELEFNNEINVKNKEIYKYLKLVRFEKGFLDKDIIYKIIDDILLNNNEYKNDKFRDDTINLILNNSLKIKKIYKELIKSLEKSEKYNTRYIDKNELEKSKTFKEILKIKKERERKTFL